MFSYLEGQNVARSDAPYIVNTVNCVGTMGKGVALAMKTRFPEIFPRYKEACDERLLVPGTVMISRAKSGQLILNMATKDKWRAPSHYHWVGSGLFYLTQILKDREPGRIAIPAPGAGNGGLQPAQVQQMARIYLAPLLERGFEVDWYGPQSDPIEGPSFYAGVGSRSVKDDPRLFAKMVDIGAAMRERGWRLRSGGAIGADTAFERGTGTGAKSEIFLAKQREQNPGILDVRDVHFRFVRNFHENPPILSDYATKLMARNGCQIFGADFTNPSSAVICWTPDAEETGGTRMAIRLAKRAGIPVINLGAPEYAEMDVDGIVAAAEQARAARAALLSAPARAPDEPLLDL